ncbi:DoxX family protein [Natronoflexus pectinivorans]|uniref:Putative oxidoreductase n=1 Tax=Natronoflexus pectinivorans TaxID=682526 RepID=A0A4R2GE45_9BACT|nr:DoxX family protein [Natronoflexus pectinivorans]TCO06012.1 putative oxidoreductase [Natronoflexus pectinivorans]
MKTLLSNEKDLAALVLRIGFGFYMVFGYGLGKLQMLFSGEIMFPGMFGLSPMISLILAVGAEFFAALLVLFGFQTRLASIPVIFTMAVAAFVVHFSDPWFQMGADGGSKELALLFMTGFLGTFFLGSGKYSLDGLISKK